jgi:hypothetical protein
MISQGPCQSGESLCSSDFTAWYLMSSTHRNASKTAKSDTSKMMLLSFILCYLYNQNANGVNSIIFCTKCSFLKAKSGVGNMELCPKYLKGSWPLLFLDPKHLHFSKAGAVSRREVWKSSICCLLTVNVRTLKCQVLARGQVEFVSPHTDGWWDHLHWIIPLVCEQFSKWWIQWGLLQYICWTLL